MHGNQWVLKIAVLKYYSVSKRGTTAKSNPKQATDPISLHTKFGDNSSNTFPLNERKPCVTPDIGRRTAEKAKIIYPSPRGVDINTSVVNGFPVCGISFRFSRKNEIRKEYLGTGYCIKVIILGYLMADTSSKWQKIYIFCKICHNFTLYWVNCKFNK